MELIDLGNNVTKVVFKGRLDTPGVDSIETRFTAALVPDGKSAIVDMSGVEFVASMGLRMFIGVGRSLMRKGAKLALYAPHPRVNAIFDGVSLGSIMPVCADEPAAVAAVAS